MNDLPNKCIECDFYNAFAEGSKADLGECKKFHPDEEGYRLFVSKAKEKRSA